MKKQFLLFLFSGSLDSFSQVPDTILPLRLFDVSKWGNPCTTSSIGPNAITGLVEWRLPVVKPDTLRAIILVTLSPNATAYARMGFVVIDGGKEVVYLDCRKKALKLPMVGWGYRLADPKYKR